VETETRYTWIVDSEHWGEGWTDEEMDAGIEAANKSDSRLTVRRAREGEVAGYYWDDGQILGYTIPVPDDVEELTNRAWEVGLKASQAMADLQG